MNAAVRKGLSVARLLTAISVTGLDCGGAETFRGDVGARTSLDGAAGTGGHNGEKDGENAGENADATSGARDATADTDVSLIGAGGAGSGSGGAGTGGMGHGGMVGSGGSG